MKRMVITLLFVLLMAAGGFAQTINMTPQYTSYQSLSVDSAGNIYSAMTVSGQTTGQCCQNTPCGPNGQMCQQCSTSCQTAHHQPQIYNWIGGVGGWANGPLVGPFDYVSWSNTANTTTPPPIGTQVESVGYGNVYCTGLAANIFSSFFDNYFKWADTKSKLIGILSQGALGWTCAVGDWCTPNTTPPLAHFGTDFDTDHTCWQYYWNRTLCVRVPTTAPWSCGSNIVTGTLTNGLGTTDPSLGSCTQ